MVALSGSQCAFLSGLLLFFCDCHNSNVFFNTTGSLLAGMESSEMLCAVLGGPAALALYSATLDTMRGLVFLVLGGVYVLAFLLMVYVGCSYNTRGGVFSLAFGVDSDLLNTP